MKIRLSELLGRKVFAVCGPGEVACEELASSVGIVESIENTRFGTLAKVQWTEGDLMGHTEPVVLHTLRPASEQCGIGVYYAD